MTRKRELWLGCLWLVACGSDDVARSDAGKTQAATKDGAVHADASLPGDAGRQPVEGGTTAHDGGQPLTQGDAATTTMPSASGHFFPDGAWMYQRIDQAPLVQDSATITKWLADNGGFGTGAIQIDTSIEVLTADANTPLRTFTKTGDFYSPDCDPAPMPVPVGGVVEGESGYACTGDGDCHLLVVDPVRKRLYEMWRANIVGNTFNGGCLAIWDSTRVYGAEGRGAQCTSADAAGFPMIPLLFTADEVAAGNIDHAIRFILPNARMRAKTYVAPGTHAGAPSAQGNAPIYGSRWRLRSSFDLSKLPSAGARVVAKALQLYGMALADGGNIALTARSDRSTTHKWDGLLDPHDLRLLSPTDFEIVDTGKPVALTNDCGRTPITQ